MSVPSPPSTTSRSARCTRPRPLQRCLPWKPDSASTSGTCPCSSSHCEISAASCSVDAFSLRGTSPTVATSRMYLKRVMLEPSMPPTHMPRGPKMDLFRAAAAKDPKLVPLAERMRPRTLDEVVGQQHILGPNTLLREAIESDHVPSLIFWGPPGTGKTTLARVIANAAKAELVALSAVD